MAIERPLNIWFKSSKSGPNCDNCVEVQFLGGGMVQVRDSKDPNGPALTFNAGEWDAHVAGQKQGEFDLPSHAR